jgi:hypothetical protein
MKACKADALAYFRGGTSLAGGHATRLLKGRAAFFDAMADAPGVDANDVASIRAKMEPLMAVLAVLNSEARRAVVLDDDDVHVIQRYSDIFADLFRMTLKKALAEDSPVSALLSLFSLFSLPCSLISS